MRSWKVRHVQISIKAGRLQGWLCRSSYDRAQIGGNERVAMMLVERLTSSDFVSVPHCGDRAFLCNEVVEDETS
jgi:hypothetical protein